METRGQEQRAHYKLFGAICELEGGRHFLAATYGAMATAHEAKGLVKELLSVAEDVAAKMESDNDTKNEYYEDLLKLIGKADEFIEILETKS